MAHDFLYGVRTRRVASAGLDGLTPILLLAYVAAMIGGGVWAHMHNSGAEGFSPSTLWTTVIVGMVLFFAVIGPMVFLGVFVASKLMKFPLGTAAYLKACGVAALPGLMLTLTQLLPRNPALIFLVVLAILPVTYYVLKTVFEVTWAEGAVAFLVSTLTGVVGLFITAFILAAVVAGAIVADQPGKGPQASIPTLPDLTKGITPNVTPHPSNAVATPGSTGSTPGVTKKPIDALKETLSTRLAQKPQTSREAQQQEAASLRAQAEQLGAKSDVLNLLADLESRVAAAPSERPEPTLFQDPGPTTAWKPADAQAGALLPDELSYKGFNFRLPEGFRVDLESSESSEKGLSFSSDERVGAKLTLRTVPAANPKQRRPWVTRASFQTAAAEAENLFTIDGSSAAEIEEGSINGVPFTRVMHEPGKRWGVTGRSVQYVTRGVDGWVIADAVASSSSSGGLASLEVSIRTLRPRPAGDPKADPFAVDALVKRFGEDPDRVAALVRAKGKAAEDAVIPLLKSEDARTARAAASVLGDIGTTKSVAPLQEAARASDAQLAQAAREAVKKLRPDAMDAVAEALIDLESGDHFKQSAALTKLAKMTPDDQRREKVATAIENQLLGKDLFFIYKEAGPALGTWAGKNTVSRLRPLIDNQHASPHERQVVMDVYAKVKDKSCVFPVVKWILLDTDNATRSLIEMGPVAEDEVIKLVKGPDAAGRTAAARILQEIGTVKSLAALKRASQDPRDANAAAAAKVALDIVNERLKAEKAAGTTAPAQ
jgi:HEAT repeat protein